MAKITKEELYSLMEELDYMDDDIEADVEEFIEMEFSGLYEKEYKGNDKKIREIWFEYCYENNGEKYSKELIESNKTKIIFATFDHTIQIKKDNKIICAFGSKYMAGYDNVQWCQLDKLVEIVKKGFTNKEELVKNVEAGTEYFHYTEKAFDDNVILDLDNNTITVPYFPIYSPEEVSPEMCCINLRKDGDDYYSIYEDNEEYLMPKVEFSDVELLRKQVVSLSEFKKICNFVNSLINQYNDTDFVLNNTWIIRFNFA